MALPWSHQRPDGLTWTSAGVELVKAVDMSMWEAPFLFAKPMLQKLGGVVDTTDNTIHMKTLGCTVHTREAPSGHMLMDLTQFPRAEGKPSIAGILLQWEKYLTF